jgi:hypothetical protein
MPRENSTGCGEDGDAEAAEHTRNILTADIATKAWTADAAESGDRRGFANIARANLDARVGLLVVELEIFDITLAFEDSDDVALNLGVRNEKFGFLNADSVTDSG